MRDHPEVVQRAAARMRELAAKLERQASQLEGRPFPAAASAAHGNGHAANASPSSPGLAASARGGSQSPSCRSPALPPSEPAGDHRTCAPQQGILWIHDANGGGTGGEVDTPEWARSVGGGVEAGRVVQEPHVGKLMQQRDMSLSLPPDLPAPLTPPHYSEEDASPRFRATYTF